MQNSSENKKSSFFYAFALLPKTKREAMNDFYTFAHLSDEIVDNPEKSTEEKTKEFSVWKSQFELGISGTSTIEVMNRIGEIIKEFNIDPQIIRELFSGMDDDLEEKEIETLHDLINYSYKVASTIGLITIEIFGYNNPGEKRFAVDLGKALQITNIMRDVKKDFMNSRIYIPKTFFTKYNYSVTELSTFKYNQAFYKLMSGMADIARSYFTSAFSTFDKSDYKTLYPAIAMGKIYFEILRKMEKKKFNIFNNDFSVSKNQKIYIVLREIAKGKIHL
jgi:phytoene synthase